jgi:TetR/AcrR family tetracycline transcriptional repressor
VWDAPARARAPLHRDDLVRAALDLLDQAGIDGLTMRNLAERLGVQAASLYNHIRDKRDVLTLIADAIVADVPQPHSGLSWREALKYIAIEYRRVLLGHRDAARVLTDTPPLGPHRLRLMDDLLGVLRAAGFSNDDVASAGWMFNTFVTGFVLDEQSQAPASPDPAAAQQFFDVASWLKQLPVNQFPNIVAVADPLFDQPMERRFAFGLEAMLDGLDVHLHHGASARTLTLARNRAKTNASRRRAARSGPNR